jgi:hypothetical protein
VCVRVFALNLITHSHTSCSTTFGSAMLVLYPLLLVMLVALQCCVGHATSSTSKPLLEETFEVTGENQREALPTALGA